MRKVLIAVFAAALLVAFAAPAFAFEVNFGGRVRTNFGYIYQTKEQTDNYDKETQTGDSIIRGFFSVAGSSYFRATFNSKDKKVGVRIEMGLGSTVTRRPVFGWYTIGNCKLVAGNNYTWAGDGVIGASSWLTDPTGGAMGLTYMGRMPMIALEWRDGNYGVQVGIFNPKDGGDGQADFGWLVPVFMVTGDIKYAMFQAAPAVAVANYQWEEGDAEGSDTSYTAFFVGLPIKGTFGPVTVMANFYYMMNGAADFGGNAMAGPITTDDGKIENTSSFGGMLEVAYKAGPIKLAGGFGGVQVSNDKWKGDAGLGYKDDSLMQYKAYLTMAYQLHANLALKPEIGYIGYGDSPKDGETEGSEFKFGLRFEFVF